MALKHSVYDTDSHYKIDKTTRAIIDQSATPTKLMQYDHNSERFTFEIDRLIDGHDMSLCDKVEVHFLNIDGSTKEFNADVYPVEDLDISPDSDDVVIFSWLISRNATKYAGVLNFRIRFVCLNDEGIEIYAWHSDIFKGIAVSNGIHNTEMVIEDYSDLLTQWKNDIDSETANKVDKIENTSSTRFVYMADKAGGAETKIALGMGSGTNGVTMPSNALMLPQYNAGRLCSNAPTSDYHVVNLKTLNEKIAESGGGSSNNWDIELNVSPDQDFVNSEVGNDLYIYLDFDIDYCSVIQIYVHTITTDAVHDSGFYQLHLWHMNGSGYNTLLSSGQQITVNCGDSNHFQLIIPQGTIYDEANYPESTVQIKVLSGSISNAGAYSDTFYE